MKKSATSRSVAEGPCSPAVPILLVILVLVIAFWVTGTAGAKSSGQLLLADSTPMMLNYQGVVEVGGAPFGGTGHFKFAIVDASAGNGTTNYWSNDGTSSGEPAASVALTVREGLFNVLLGDTSLAGMTQPVGEPVFARDPTYLRAWFSPTGSPGTFEALEPNQRIVSVAYALHAKYAENSEPGPPGPQGPTGPVGPPGPVNPNADTVDGLHAAAGPEPRKLVALDASAMLRVPAVRDSDDTDYLLDPAGRSSLNHINLRGTLYDSVGARVDVEDDLVANRYIDRQDNSYAVDPAGTSRLNNLSWTGHLQSMELLGPYQASSSGGTNGVSMISASNSICFLTEVRFSETDSAGEESACHVALVAGTWRLNAYAQAGNDNTAYCRARCLRW